MGPLDARPGMRPRRCSGHARRRAQDRLTRRRQRRASGGVTDGISEQAIQRDRRRRRHVGEPRVTCLGAAKRPRQHTCGSGAAGVVAVIVVAFTTTTLVAAVPPIVVPEVGFMPFHVVVTFIAMTLVTAVAPVGLVPVIVTVGAGVADGEGANLPLRGGGGKRGRS